jgi:hypothetical protein
MRAFTLPPLPWRPEEGQAELGRGDDHARQPPNAVIFTVL